MVGENCENIKQHPAPVQSVQAMGNLGGIDVGIDGKTAVAVSKPCLDRSSKGEQTGTVAKREFCSSPLLSSVAVFCCV